MQAKISLSSVVLRAALIKERQKQQAAIAALTVQPGCNRTVDMQYAFVVGHNCIYRKAIARLNNKLPWEFFVELYMMHSASPANAFSALLWHKHTSQHGSDMYKHQELTMCILGLNAPA